MPNPLKPLDDAFETREREFVKAQGISELGYTELLEQAVLHTASATLFPGAPNWRFVGPRNLGGRIIALSQDPVDPRIIYVGSAHGGLWRSIDAGDTWERLGAAEHVFPVGTIAVAPSAPNTVYFGTGALHPSYVSGRGLFRATITGTTGPATIERLVAPDNPTVAPKNATPGASLRYTRIRVDPYDPTRFWAASQSGLWRCECPLGSPPAPRFFRDFPDASNKPDAAALVTQLNGQGLWPAHCTDVLVASDPRETDTVPLNGVDVPRYLILYVSIDSVGIFRGRFDRKDASINFESSKLSLPMGTIDFGRIRLAQCERHPEHVAAIMSVVRPSQGPTAGSFLTQAVDGSGNPIPFQYHATNGTGGASPALRSLIRAGEQLVVNDGVNPAEPQTVNEVLNDTDLTVLAPYATPIPGGGIFYFRAAAPDNNHATEVFRSSNNGDSWTKGEQRMSAVDALSGQADYDLFLEIAPDDPSIVVAGEGDVCISKDGGDHWTKILDWLAYDRGDKAQHADQHIAMFDRGDHRRLWIGNDGGLSMARDLRLPAQANGYWRKRSHGIYAGMCQDVSVNPSLTFMCAAGFQDNGTFLSLGGPTWYHVGGADGGAVAFNLPNPRQFAVTWQGLATGEGIEQVDAVASDSPLSASPGAWYDLVSNAGGDIPVTIARGHRIRYRWTPLSTAGSGITTRASFVGVIEQHPVTPGQLIAGRRGDAYFSTNFGNAWTPLIPAVGPNPAIPIAPSGEVPAVAFGPVDAHNPVPGAVDGWAGNSFGTLYFTPTAPGPGWAPLTNQLPFPGTPMRISEIVVHPFDRRIVVVSATGLQGRVFITYNHGRSWIDITEPTPTAFAVTPAGASIGVGQTRGFTATATYTGGVVVDVTARAAWSSNNTLQATVVDAQLAGNAFVTGFGTEGQVTGVAAGAPTITATLIAGVANGSASQAVTITPGAQPVVPLAVAPRTIVPNSLPPGPTSSVIFDPSVAAGAVATLFAGTLTGVFALGAVPVVQSLAIQPGGPLVFQTGAAPFQLRCVATFTDGTQVDVTKDVDWSTNAAGVVAVDIASPNEGRIRIIGVGAATISADRGGVPVATIAINVQAAAAPAPPALPAAPAATNPRINVEWKRYNTGMPQVLVTDFERVAGTNAVRAATFGLGVFEVVTAGGPLRRLHIRQTIIEDGRAPRNPLAVPDDPRLPAGIVALDMTHAFDIRVDAPPYSFFDDVVDGVEMDEQVEVSDPVPTEDNYIYVQVHNTGTSETANVTVHLYAAECAAGDIINPIGAAATASPASLDAGAPIADFYGQPNRDPIPASRWKRVDTARRLDKVASDAPRVARFTWRPDVALAGKNVALLALCEGQAPSNDPLPAAPAAATLSAFILAERRAALRVVRVAARPDASIYVRDGVADDTRIGGYPVGGRSPDIMVVHPDIGSPATEAFKDFVARRGTDTVSGTGTNVIYVRVHNRRRFPTTAEVKVYAIRLNDSNEPDRNIATWTELPAGAAFAEAVMQPSSVAYARVEFPGANDPNPTGTSKNYLLLALVRAKGDVTDPFPSRDRVDSVDSFWDLVSRYVDSDNAAARAVPWVP